MKRLGFWLLFLVGPSWAQPVMTPELVAKLRTATSVQLSADGTQAIYTVSQPRVLGRDDFEDGPPDTQVFRLGENASAQPLVTQRGGVQRVQFGARDQSLCFLSKRSGDESICGYQLPLSGGEPQRFLCFSSDIVDFAIDPRGHRVAFIATPPLDAAHQRLRKVGFQAQVFEEDWKNVRLYLTTPGPDKVDPTPVPLPGSAGEVHWSPDGDSLAVTVAPDPGVDADLMYRKVHILGAASGKLKAILDVPGKLGPLAFSPDGLHLALIRGEDAHDPDAGRLFVADCSNGKMRELWPNLSARVSKVVWIGDSRLRALLHRGLVSEVWDIDLTGHAQLVVPAGQQILTDLACSQGGKRTLYVGDSPRHPGEVIENGQTLTRLNPVLHNLRWAKQEPYTYRARDGQSIEGVLIHPLDEVAGRAYPLILFVHGGPESMVLNGWLNGHSQPGQIAAARGFASFYPNYRGSIGRSVEFSKLGQGDPAGREFDDLVDGVDALVASGLVDTKKVGVTGGSYGGYAAAWCSTYYSHRFACACMYVGISDKISKSGTTDIPDEEFLVHARKRPWDHWQFFMERSPIHHVKKHQTPLLILHGKEDPRVHPAQSLELYRYLKMVKQAPVRLVLYPGEGHGNRKAAARYDLQLRILEWMEHYLKGPGGNPPSWDLQPKL